MENNFRPMASAVGSNWKAFSALDQISDIYVSTILCSSWHGHIFILCLCTAPLATVVKVKFEAPLATVVKIKFEAAAFVGRDVYVSVGLAPLLFFLRKQSMYTYVRHLNPAKNTFERAIDTQGRAKDQCTRCSITSVLLLLLLLLLSRYYYTY